ncbi:MAG: Segregation and condensation protein [Evtepia sp.]|jgi:segregation and condensation protein B|nr:Segregation and condensation protein [Evtepia sp.]
MEWSELHAAIEGILFASSDAISIEQLCQGMEESRLKVEQALQELMDEYQFARRGIRIIKLEESYQMVSSPEYAATIREILGSRKVDRLSKSALEVLSIVAYYQPVTKAYLEQIRGVDSSYTLGLLLDRELLEECGRLDMPGRPILYRTTQSFLRAFGLSSLEDLPELPVVEEGQREKGCD